MESLVITLIVLLIVMTPAFLFAVIFAICEKFLTRSKRFRDLSERLF